MSNGVLIWCVPIWGELLRKLTLAHQRREAAITQKLFCASWVTFAIVAFLCFFPFPSSLPFTTDISKMNWSWCISLIGPFPFASPCPFPFLFLSIPFPSDDVCLSPSFLSFKMMGRWTAAVRKDWVLPVHITFRLELSPVTSWQLTYW